MVNIYKKNLIFSNSNYCISFALIYIKKLISNLFFESDSFRFILNKLKLQFFNRGLR